MEKYRKKPVVIEAMRWMGDNWTEISAWYNASKVDDKELTIVHGGDEPDCLYIPTLEGKMKGDLGDWIIRGVAGEFYPCKPEIFEQIYELVKEYPVPESVHPSVKSILRHFSYLHLPMHLQPFSGPICEVAVKMANSGLEGPETTAGLRKLLEAKDCFVRAALERD